MADLTPPEFPPIRACLFDVDGLLINSEDIYTEMYNNILHEYGAPDYPWRIKATQQSRGHSGHLRILKWANIPITLEQWKEKEKEHVHLFSKAKILPGVVDLLNILKEKTDPKILIALASSAARRLFDMKTAQLPQLQHVFPEEYRVFGDDTAMQGRERKPAPDSFLLAKKMLDDALSKQGQKQLEPLECLVFEDSIAGVEAGRRAGMRVVWVPHPELANVCRGREQEVLMGVTEMEGTPTWDEPEEDDVYLPTYSLVSDDRRVTMLRSLQDFPYSQYGIKFNAE